MEPETPLYLGVIPRRGAKGEDVKVLLPVAFWPSVRNNEN